MSLSSDLQHMQGTLRLGKRMCGHPAFIHGGAIASVLDDCMGILFLSSGHGTGFTANLNVDYRRPIPAGSLLRVDVRLTGWEVGKSGKKKVFLTGRILSAEEGKQPVVFAEATSIFIVKLVPGLHSLLARLG